MQVMLLNIQYTYKMCTEKNADMRQILITDNIVDIFLQPALMMCPGVRVTSPQAPCVTVWRTGVVLPARSGLSLTRQVVL